ncbi:hypothetical protein FSARC_10074 [Fusarium sarcochroum]|uniref:Transcription factor domain-containing protein n=1 Tax=Fusarium sarcochroum TaxID=1208366 RepID=A0A8H4TPR0_9HYPO|nr:hypothetical protein FSARC_10074 [Fusarium sarcochroum]
MPLPRNSISIDSVEQEEAIRAFWMTEMLDGVLTVGLPDQYTHGDPPLSVRLPCMESLWSCGAVRQSQPASPRPHYSSGFSLCIMLAVEELGVVRTFLKKPFELSRLEQRLDWQSEAQRIDERLTNWREEFVANVFQLINYEKEHVPKGEMEPFFTLTNCLLNMYSLLPRPIRIDFAS